MGQVKYSEAAQFDIEDIFKFIAKNSVKFATKEINFIKTEIERLILNPKLGKQYQYSESKKYREFVITHYRIIYSIQDGDILVHFVHHSARDIKRRKLS